jgi:hypothetical protein
MQFFMTTKGHALNPKYIVSVEPNRSKSFSVDSDGAQTKISTLDSDYHYDERQPVEVLAALETMGDS